MEPETTDQPEPETVDQQPAQEPQTDPTDTPEPAEPDTETVSQPAQEPESDITYYKRRAEEAEARSNATHQLISDNMSQRDRLNSDALERERVMNMTPEERIIYAGEQSEKRIQQITADAEKRIADANDKAEYAALMVNNPMAAKLKEEVETRLADAKAQGYNYSRTVMATFIAGEKAMKASLEGPSQKQKQIATENIQNSETSPTVATGDQKINGRIAQDDRAARNERLKGGRFGSAYR